MRSCLGLVLNQEEHLHFLFKERLGHVESVQCTEGVVHDIRGNTHPRGRKYIELLLCNERKYLSHRIRLLSIQLQIGDRIWLEIICREYY